MTEEPWWRGKSEDEIQAHLEAVRARLDAQHVAELEAALDLTPGPFTWPPAPNTVHPSFERQAPFVRDLITQGRYQVYLPAPMKALWRTLTEPEIMPELPPDPIVLNVQKCWALAPWCDRPYVYMWRVAVDDKTNRWVAGDSWAAHPPPGHERRAR